MAEVTVVSLPAQGPQGFQGKGISSVAISESGHLIVAYTDATTTDAGYVIGSTGAAGTPGRGITSLAVNGSNRLIATFTDLSTTDLGSVIGPQGIQGEKGWAPVLAVVADGARRVFQVSDWTGGQGTKPTTGLYVGIDGLTAVLADGIDVRGPAGTGTGNVNPSGTIVAGRLAAFADTTGNVIVDAGPTFTRGGIVGLSYGDGIGF